MTAKRIKSPKAKYLCQKWRAKSRGIAWEISFEEWWAIWDASGKYHLRGGAAHNYVMARFGDKGPYHKDNVRICLASENNKESVINRGHVVGGKPRPKANGCTFGYGKGFCVCKDKKIRPYRSQFRGKLIGHFATEQEARAAYLSAVQAHKDSLK